MLARRPLREIALALCVLAAPPAQARITRIDVTAVESPTFGGYRWPGVGQYEKIVGVAHGEVDPQDPKNAVITDIDLAPLNSQGRVEYSFDFYILKPIDLRRGAHKVVYEPPNRGHKTWSAFARVPVGDDPGSTLTDPQLLAHSFFMPRGYTLVWSGWDKTAGAHGAGPALTITLPTATHRDGSRITGPAYEYIVGDERTYVLSYPAATRNKTWARLTHRVHLDDPPEDVPSDAWDYDADGTAISLSNGRFASGDVYEFSYTAADPTVNGLGLAAVRDFNAWLRYSQTDDAGHINPLAHDVRRIYTSAYSQPARMLNDFRHLGFNQAESGGKVFDGMLQWLAAGDGLDLNRRFSQPGRSERNRQDHRYAEGVFPFANVAATDPVTGQTDSRLARCQATTTCPVSVEILSANEYWAKAGSLLHTTPDGRHDLPYSRYTRDYLVSGTAHGVGDPASRGVCQQRMNPLDGAPIARALFLALDAWTEGIAPPASRVPRIADGTLVAPLPQSAVAFPTIPGVTYTGLKTTRYRWDFGPDYAATGIATINPPAAVPPYEDNTQNGPIYPSGVPATDRDGNDIAGVRLPDVSVPLATYTGWALRAGPQANDGCEGAGQMIPLPRTQAERIAAGDPRLAITERFPDAGAYGRALAQALDDLVKDRLMLCEDVEAQYARLTEAGMAAGVPPGGAPPGGTPPGGAPPGGTPPGGASPATARAKALRLPHCRT